MSSFQNKTIFITGASRGIGKAIALRLASEGANIVVAAKSTEENPKLGGTIYSAAAESLAPKPVLQFGRVDYGSALRDAAALVSLAGEGNAPKATLMQAVSRVEAARYIETLRGVGYRFEP